MFSPKILRWIKKEVGVWNNSNHIHFNGICWAESLHIFLLKVLMDVFITCPSILDQRLIKLSSSQDIYNSSPVAWLLRFVFLYDRQTENIHYRFRMTKIIFSPINIMYDTLRAVWNKLIIVYHILQIPTWILTRLDLNRLYFINTKLSFPTEFQ